MKSPSNLLQIFAVLTFLLALKSVLVSRYNRNRQILDKRYNTLDSFSSHNNKNDYFKNGKLRPIKAFSVFPGFWNRQISNPLTPEVLVYSRTSGQARYLLLKHMNKRVRPYYRLFDIKTKRVPYFDNRYLVECLLSKDDMEALGFVHNFKN